MNSSRGTKSETGETRECLSAVAIKALTSRHNSEQATMYSPQWKEAQTIVWKKVKTQTGIDSKVPIQNRQFQFRTDSNDERVVMVQSIVSPTDAVC